MPTDNSHTDNDLFRQIAKGDENAYTRIFHIYTPKLFPYILRITKDEQLAKELLQETFIKLWVKRDHLETVSNPSSWLFRIAANVCLSYLRVQAVRNQLQDKVFKKMEPGSYSSTERLEGKDMELLIYKAVQEMPSKRKEVYLLSREEGLSYQEIADRMGLSVNTVKNHLGFALKSIQEYLHLHTGLSLTALLILLSQ